MKLLSNGLKTCLLVALVSQISWACAIPISYYDATTYRSLTDLKVDATRLVARFDSVKAPGDSAAIADVRVRFLKALEYEKGKGRPNDPTLQQLDIILGLLDEDIKDHYGKTNLGPSYFAQASRALGQAFDIAIATEAAKNKDKN